MSVVDTEARPIGWRELVVDGRLPRFALICAGSWLGAADELVTATIMPSAAREIGGFSAFGWAVAIFLLGSILGGATAGRLSLRLGLKPSMALAGAAYALGCSASALAPTMGFFLAGRLLQGLGGGWVLGLSYVAVNRLFPQPLWSRVLSGLAGVWGVATLVSPLIGGLFAQAGFWRGAFWFFAVQGVGFIAAASLLVPAAASTEPQPAARPPFVQIAVLALAVAAIGGAGLWRPAAIAAVSAAAGLALLGLFLHIDGRAESHLLPRAVRDPRSAAAAGLFLIFSLNVATVGFSVYGTALLQRLYGAPPILAGYILGAGALAWTVTALGVVGRSSGPGAIRTGVVVIALAQAGLMIAVPHGSIALIGALILASGGGFGLAWAFIASRIVANTPEAEQALASSSVPTASMIGAAVGAAASGAIASGLGFGRGMSFEQASAAGFWLFAAFAPFGLAAGVAAWRLTAERFDPA
jgi:MFS family permease